MQECCPPLLQNAWQINYYAIIYDHDHSKHINDHLRCRQDNGATCLNCKVDFLLEKANHHLVSPSSPPPLPPRILSFWNASSLSQSISSSTFLPLCFFVPTIAFPISPQLPASESFSAPWHDQRQLCDTLWGTQEAENIKPLTWKGTHAEGQSRPCRCVKVCVQ